VFRSIVSVPTMPPFATILRMRSKVVAPALRVVPFKSMFSVTIAPAGFRPVTSMDFADVSDALDETTPTASLAASAVNSTAPAVLIAPPLAAVSFSGMDADW